MAPLRRRKWQVPHIADSCQLTQDIVLQLCLTGITEVVPQPSSRAISMRRVAFEQDTLWVVHVLSLDLAVLAGAIEQSVQLRRLNTEEFIAGGT